MSIYRSLIGIIVVFFIAWLCSTNKKAINWRTVLVAFAIQAGFGMVALYIPLGRQLFAFLATGVSKILGFANAGISFVFGPLAEIHKTGFVFAINVLGVIIFFAALLSVLYHLGIMQKIIQILGGIFQKILGTTRVESLYAVANVFLGQSESPLAIKPYIAGLTRSELFTAMTCGMAAVSGAILAGYAAMGVQMKFLITASFMSAPGAIVISKLLLPEVEEKQIGAVKVQHEVHANVFDAAASGAASGARLAVNVGAMLLAFTALIAMLNGFLGWLGEYAGNPSLSMQQILGYVFSPVAWMLGIPWHEAVRAGGLIGEKIVFNEFMAYASMSKVSSYLSQYSQAIVTFALCGFANLSSIAVQLGLLGSIAPSRRAEVARLGLMAVFAGTLANLMSAAIAGAFLALCSV